MSKLLVTGKNKLYGETFVQGAKNSTLPILAASLLTNGENLIFNCPKLSDVEASCEILRYLGCNVKRYDDTMIVNATYVDSFDIPDELMRKTRSSIVFMGAVLARMGRAKLSLPGGCEIGHRPIDMHLKALKMMGAVIREKHGYLNCSAPKGLHGTKIALPFPSVGATEDIMVAASTANGTTTITNAAREPEICDLAEYLNSCGARVYGAGEGTIVIDGVDKLTASKHTIIPDRIVAATLMSCAAVTSSQITLKGVIPSHLSSVIPVFEEAGCRVICNKNEINFIAPSVIKSMKTIRTMPYPGFPTDAQAVLMAASSVANGTTVFVENIFENRYRHISELVRMGANIKTEGKVAIVEGVKSLYGANTNATDLRGAAALVVASLCAEGKSEISGVKYLERGYESFEQKLSALGADIKKI